MNCRIKNFAWTAFVAFGCLSVVSLAPAVAITANDEPAKQAPSDRPRDEAASAAAFKSILPVLHHPRCMNCHSSGDYPRQGDDSHPHLFDIQRGPDGHGVNAVKCSTCHQNHNLAGVHTPPGAHGWALPPTAMAMIWEGLTDHQLCTLLKDPKQNGHRSIEQIVAHVHTPLVLWGWNPGEGRTPIQMPQGEFLRRVSEWASNGAACPR